MNKKQFKTRKELSAFLKEKNIDTTNWSEEKWLSLSKSGAEIHIQALAEAVWDAKNESKPELLPPGTWHIPFGGKLEDLPIMSIFGIKDDLNTSSAEIDLAKIKVATARCARLSYLTFDGKIDYQKDIDLFNMLLSSKHMSPFEHCARVMNDEEYASFRKGKMRLEWLEKIHDKLYPSFENDYYDGVTDGWCNNFKGFIPYRYLIENANKNPGNE